MAQRHQDERSLDKYFDSIRDLPLLTAAEERKYGRLWQNERNPEGLKMLVEGNRLKREGVDVVVGLLETHGRAETARLHGASNVAAEDWYRGWSDSSLAPFSPAKLREIRQAEKAERRRALVTTSGETGPGAVPPVAVIEPAGSMPKPTPDAQEPEAFAQEVEQMMKGQAETGAEAVADEGGAVNLSPAGPLPEPAEPTTTAPFTFEPAAPAETGEPPAPAPAPPKKRKSRRALIETPVDREPKPSMFPAPAPGTEEQIGVIHEQ